MSRNSFWTMMNQVKTSMLSYSYMHENKESAEFEIHDDADSIFDQWAQFIDYNLSV